MIEGHLGKKIATGFTFISEGYEPGEWEFVEVTYENYRDKYRMLSMDKGSSALATASNTEELIQYFRDLE